MHIQQQTSCAPDLIAWLEMTWQGSVREKQQSQWYGRSLGDQGLSKAVLFPRFRSCAIFAISCCALIYEEMAQTTGSAFRRATPYQRRLHELLASGATSEVPAHRAFQPQLSDGRGEFHWSSVRARRGVG